ncbi:hypothetical protein K7X08_037730 [Anisodus acutangulus]|uniref:F-box domain-containing protein n=1 Tax=Anisodus acutangulus TaxID=402998 RepID=A0A9Q1N1G5_9SOLA|nr:hypothetical protein K7X08_037730 [Anisodus acutangulus]
MKEKKSNPHERKLANTCAPKIQKNKTIKANFFNQNFSNGQENINLFKGLPQKKKKFKSIANIYDNTEQMDIVNQAMGIQFQEDIIMEILSILPLRYLVQFKCVSKLCKPLISHPYFIKKHLNHAKNDRDYQKLLIYQHCLVYGISSLYCCPLSSAQLVENVQELDCPSNSKIVVHCCCNGLAVIGVADRISGTFILML